MEEEFVFSSGELAEFDALCGEIRRRIKSGAFVSGVFVQRAPISESWLRSSAMRARKEKGASQREIGQKLKLSQMAVSDFEIGRSTPRDWKGLLKAYGVQLGHPNFARMAFAGALFGEAAHMARFKNKVDVRDIALQTGITQKKYREFEKGVDMTFEETERVLGYLGFTAL